MREASSHVSTEARAVPPESEKLPERGEPENGKDAKNEKSNSETGKNGRRLT